MAQNLLQPPVMQQGLAAACRHHATGEHGLLTGGSTCSDLAVKQRGLTAACRQQGRQLSMLCWHAGGCGAFVTQWLRHLQPARQGWVHG